MVTPGLPTLDLRTTALFLDIDGTILDFASRPDLVIVPRTLVDAINKMRRGLSGAFALISGRTIAEIDQLFAPLKLCASGIHGAEIRFSGEAEIETRIPGQLPKVAWTDLVAVVERFPGALIENKGVAFAIHYRAIEDRAPALAAALTGFMARFPELNIEMVAGHLVFEIKFSGFNKGIAIEHFMERPEFVERKPIYIADGEIDRLGFAAALSLGGRAYSVGAELPGLTGWVSGPEAVRLWLGQVAS